MRAGASTLLRHDPELDLDLTLACAMCVYAYSVKCCQMVRAVPVELCFANAFAEICVACVPSCLTAGFDAVRCCSCEECRNVKKKTRRSVLSLSAEAYEAEHFSSWPKLVVRDNQPLEILINDHDAHRL